MANEKSQPKGKDSTDANLGQPKVLTATRMTPTGVPEFAHFTEGEWSEREKEGWVRTDTPVTEFPNADASDSTKKEKSDA